MAVFLAVSQSVAVAATEDIYPLPIYPLPEMDQTPAAHPAVATEKDSGTDASSFEDQAREMRIWMRQRDQERKHGGGSLDLNLPEEFRSGAVEIPKPFDPFSNSSVDESGYRAWGDNRVKLRHRTDAGSGRSGHRVRRDRDRHGKSVKTGEEASAAGTKKNADKALSPSDRNQALVAESKKGRGKKSHEHADVNKNKADVAVEATHIKQHDKRGGSVQSADKKQNDKLGASTPPVDKKQNSKPGEPVQVEHKKQKDKSAKSASTKARK